MAVARVSNLHMALPPAGGMGGLQLKATQSGSELITAMRAAASTHKKWQGRRVGQCMEGEWDSARGEMIKKKT